MPVLINPRYERFAQGIAKGKTQHEAYRYAGYSPNRKPDQMRSEASKLSKRPEVADRIVELQEKQAKRVGVTVDALLGELDDMLKLAMRVKHPAAGVGAILGKAKLLGLVIDKAEIEGTIRKPARRPTEDKQTTMEQWLQTFAPPGTVVSKPEGPLQ